MSGAYYNEIDPYAAQWLRNLIAAGHIAPGDVDERSIVDVRPDDLRGYTQCHFFAGIGIWSYALRKAGWPDDEEVWTGSCPCQPFSAAGKGEAFDDERDLWPVWFSLIRECRPVAVLGEQVASKLGLAWLDALHADMESEAYTVGAVDTCSAGVGSPNIRQRLYWVANAYRERRDGLEVHLPQRGSQQAVSETSRGSDAGGLADAKRGTAERHGLALAGATLRTQGEAHERERIRHDARDGELSGRVDHAPGGGRSRRDRTGKQEPGARAGCAAGTRPGPTNGFWRDADWLCCTDGKWRAVEPGTFPLVNGAPSRMGRLRAYGNGLNAEAATEFIRATRFVR